MQDIPELQDIGRITFYETFAACNTEEYMNVYLDEGFSTSKLSAGLSDQDTEYYMAVYEQKVIGYLKINAGPAQTELQDQKAIEIERIYVLQELDGKNIGQLLFEKAVERARLKGAVYIWLGVWEHNPRAIHFCLKHGFVVFDKHIFILGNDEQTAILMKLDLHPS